MLIKNINSKRIIFLFFAVLFACITVFSVYSCGDKTGGGDSGGTTNAADNQQNSETGTSDQNTPTTEAYIYPEMDGGGKDFTFFSPSTTWGYYTNIVRDEISGEVLDDAIYNRNRFIEDKFNINLKEVNRDIAAISGDLKKLISAGDNSYDAAFCPAFYGVTVGSMITSNMFCNLYDIPTMNLNAPWYNQRLLKEAAIGKGNRIYYAGCDINVMTVQCVVFIYFNQDMMSNLGLELPYNAVRAGKWTFDMFYDYMKAGANLNGADTFKWDANAQTTYGFVAHDNCAVALLEGSGEKFITTDSDGTPHLAIENERFINAISKIQDMLVNSPAGYYLYANDATGPFHFEQIFKNNRSLMITGELKAADVFTDMETTFGIAPMPKFDSNQKDYDCQLHFATPVLVIPNTNANLDFTGAVLDAMAYVSAKDVTPVLFDVSVSQKRLRNEDSIEMLHLIKNSGSFDVGSAYGWTTDFYNLIKSTLGFGKPFDVVSQIAKNKDKINAKIEKTMEFFQN